MRVQNTKKEGKVTIFTYKKGKKFISVCLELDIIKEGNEPNQLIQEMIEAVMGHVETVCLNNLDDALLNRPAPQKYWQAYEEFLESQQKSKNEFGFLNVLPLNELCRV